MRSSSRHPTSFKGPRPAITSAPPQITYNQIFYVQTPAAATIAKVSLIRFGTATHATNMSQQFVPLSFSPGPGYLTVTGPHFSYDWITIFVPSKSKRNRTSVRRFSRIA